jgi:hypothetical protein
MSRSLLVKGAFLACILLMVPIYHDNVIIIIMSIMLLVKSSLTKRQMKMSYVPQSYVPHKSIGKILTGLACLGIALLFGGLIFLVHLSLNPPVETTIGLGFS